MPLSKEILEQIRYIDDWVYTQTSGIVQSGPFKGMKLLRERAWDEGALSPMLLGCYEAELHSVFEEEIKRLAQLEHPTIVNIGCGEGYYAIGLARLLPKAIVWGVDIDDNSLRLAKETAALNQVNLNVLKLDVDRKERLIYLSSDFSNLFIEPDLVVMDCEGAETYLLSPKECPELYPGLFKPTIIAEIHEQRDFIQQGFDIESLDEPNITGSLIVERWKDSHHITAYFEGGRNPNMFDFLRRKSSICRWLAMCEYRPCQMFWFHLTPKKEVP